MLLVPPGTGIVRLQMRQRMRFVFPMHPEGLQGFGAAAAFARADFAGYRMRGGHTALRAVMDSGFLSFHRFNTPFSILMTDKPRKWFH